MSYAIISSQTGKGHNSVMQTLLSEFKIHGISDVVCYPTFYEDMMISNKILSDFYNFLMSNSIELCNMYCEFTALTRYDVSEQFYIGVKDFVVNFLMKNEFEAIISVSHTINAAMIRLIKELKLETKYYIVIPDPFEPIAVGYDVPGATRYYCANDTVKNILLHRKINKNLIEVVGYPFNKQYLYKKEKKLANQTAQTVSTILVNSGSQGTYSFFLYLEMLCEFTEYKIIFMCGKNFLLYKKCERYIQRGKYEDRVIILPFIDNVFDFLMEADIEITKAGANTFFEALAMRIPVLIDSKYMLYQEKGVRQFINKYKVGEMLDNPSECIEKINGMLKKKEIYEKNILGLKLENGSCRIIESILSN